MFLGSKSEQVFVVVFSKCAAQGLLSGHHWVLPPIFLDPALLGSVGNYR